MLISTRGRYALRVLIDMAENNTGDYIAMKSIAARQDISLKYLEKILPSLVENKLVEGVHGKGGGYRLTRKPEEYKVGEILMITEGGLAPVSCLECNDEVCEKKDTCKTLPMWTELQRRMSEYLDSVTVADLASGKVKI